MKVVTLFVAILVASLAPTVGATETATVRLVVDAANPHGPVLHDCSITVPKYSTAAAVLDAAVLNECIREWSGTHYPGMGRFVDSIDDVRGAPFVTYWQFVVNGESASQGVDVVVPEDGDTLRFSYSESVTIVAEWLLGEVLP